MKREIALRWIEALRDPSTKQTQGRLGKPDGSRCCLGVLCDVMGVPFYKCGGMVAKLEGPGITVLPRIVQELADMASPNGELGNRTLDNLDNLAIMNDNGASFTEIADIIEQNWEKL